MSPAARPLSPAGEPRPALYVRALRLRRLRPSSLGCFLLLEGMVAVGVVLALTELVSWWVVVLLPAAVALMVKLNDLILVALHPAVDLPEHRARAPRHAAGEPMVPAQPGGHAGPSHAGPVTSRDLSGALDPADSPRQRHRQSARRRYG